MIKLALQTIVDNNLKVWVYDSASDILCDGQLTKVLDSNNNPLYYVDVDKFAFRGHEIRRIEFYPSGVDIYHGM